MPLSRLTLRWLGPYATAFNRRHRRVGYLFQIRFKSVLVEQDAYFLELVRYIHLNPVRSRLLVSIAKHRPCAGTSRVRLPQP
jgi:putative transposase